MCRAPESRDGGDTAAQNIHPLFTNMSKFVGNTGESTPEENALGIVVRDGQPAPARPRAVAFVYGGQVKPQPSLPYGRWKREVRSAA
jgi:hypothetical protein